VEEVPPLHNPGNRSSRSHPDDYDNVSVLGDFDDSASTSRGGDAFRDVSMTGGTFDNHAMLEDLDAEWNPSGWETFKASSVLNSRISMTLANISLLDRTTNRLKQHFGLEMFALRDDADSDGRGRDPMMKQFALFSQCKKKVDAMLDRIRLRELRYGELVRLQEIFNLKLQVRDQKRLLGIKIYKSLKVHDVVQTEALFKATERTVVGFQEAIVRKQFQTKRLAEVIKRGHHGADTITSLTGDLPSGGWYGVLETKKKQAQQTLLGASKAAQSAAAAKTGAQLPGGLPDGLPGELTGGLSGAGSAEGLPGELPGASGGDLQSGAVMGAAFGAYQNATPEQRAAAFSAGQNAHASATPEQRSMAMRVLAGT